MDSAEKAMKRTAFKNLDSEGKSSSLPSLPNSVVKSNLASVGVVLGVALIQLIVLFFCSSRGY